VRGAVDELPALVPQLMSAIVMPYLGIEAAMSELSRESAATEGYARGVARKRAGKSKKPPSDGAEGYPPELARLPPGRHGLPREFVTHNQRERLIAGIAEAVAEHGYSGTTIAHITRAAAVSRRTFYEHFASKDECFVAAYDMVMKELRERVSAGFEETEDWPHAIRAGIEAMLSFLAANPSLARLCMVEALVAGPAVVERYDAAIQSFVPYFQQGREGRSPEVLSRLSPTTEEALVGGMVSLISRRIIAARTEELEDLLPDLVEFTLTPYLGSAEAAEVAKSD
jgi:AcrR family transcriptional regulator